MLLKYVFASGASSVFCAMLAHGQGPTTRQVPLSMVGNWEGSIEQSGVSSPVQLSLTPTGGKIFFPGRQCGGTLLLTMAAGKAFGFQEALTFNRGGCENGGSISLGEVGTDGSVVIAELQGKSAAMGKLTRATKAPQIPDNEGSLQTVSETTLTTSSPWFRLESQTI